MAKTPTKGSKGGKETIIPPAKPVLTRGSKDMRKGDPAGARAMSDAAVAKREGVKRPPGKK